MQVQSSPRIVNPSVDQSTADLVVGSSLLVHCLATGVPDPLIHWERAGLRIPSNDSLGVFTVGTLRINSVTMEDSGRYTCVASNVAGEDRTNYDVEVQCWAFGDICTCFQTLIVGSIFSTSLFIIWSES
jgi:hemicentin